MNAKKTMSSESLKSSFPITNFSIICKTKNQISDQIIIIYIERVK